MGEVVQRVGLAFFLARPPDAKYLPPHDFGRFLPDILVSAALAIPHKAHQTN
jgi:hypothetical protein